MSAVKKIESFSISEIEKYDFANGHATVFGDLAIPITNAIVNENDTFLIFVLNHKEKKYTIGKSGSLRSYMYVVGRYLNGGRSAGGGSSLSKVIDKDQEQHISAEIIVASLDNFNACMETLKKWRCVGGHKTYEDKSSIVLMRAIHKPTGWSRFFTVEESKAHSITPLRWTQLRSSLTDLNSTKVIGVEPADKRNAEFILKINKIKSRILEDIKLNQNFSFDVVAKASTAVEIKKLCSDVRFYNQDYFKYWFTKQNIIDLADNTGNVVVAKNLPPVKPFAQKEKLLATNPTVAALQEQLADVEKKIAEHEPPAGVSLKDYIGLGPIPTQTEKDEETEIIELKLDGEVEELYSKHRESYAKALTLRIVLRSMGCKTTVTGMAEAIANVINASPMFVNLIGEVTPLMIENAIIHNVAPSPQQDFLFFEIINIVSQYVEKKVCHE